MVVVTHKARVLENEKISNKLNIIKFSAPDNFNFIPGQYISIATVVDGKKIRRSYSISSKPGEKFIEICLKRVLNGVLSGKICDLKINDEIEFIGPLGRFIISDESKNKNLVFISTGTGIGPFVSMISHLLEKEHYKKKITAISGFKTEKDVLYNSLFASLKKRFLNFEFYNILSQPERETKNKGYVQDYFDRIINDDENHFYICGLKDMVDSVIIKLKEMVITDDKIFFEKYD